MMITDGKKTEIFECGNPDAPLIILNTYGDEGKSVYLKCAELDTPEFNMAVVSGLDWDNDMSPWKAQSIVSGSDSYGGKADEHLSLLTDRIIPEVINVLKGKPEYIALAGYSLGGLFAVYSLLKSGVFSAAVSASGSFWFPEFTEFAKKEIGKLKADCIYLSLGDREKYTKNEYLQSVQDKTQELHDLFEKHGIKTVFELNKGNHFRQSDLRTAKGIKWVLENKQA